MIRYAMGEPYPREVAYMRMQLERLVGGSESNDPVMAWAHSLSEVARDRNAQALATSTAVASFLFNRVSIMRGSINSERRPNGRFWIRCSHPSG